MIKQSISKFLFIGLALMGTASGSLSASVLDDSGTTESYGFFVRDLQICHQGEWRHMTVTLEYESEVNGKAMDVQSVRNHVRQFLEEYSNTTDFWEVMNTKLVHSLIQEYPDINVMNSKLSLAPDRTLSFPRESIVRYEKGSEFFKESFNFTKLNYLICNESFQSLDLHVAFDLKDSPSPEDYPDYQWVDQAMEEFFKVHPISYSNWSELKPKLETFLLERFPSLRTIEVTVTVAS